MIKEVKMSAVVHIVGSVTREGYRTHWLESLVVIGKNPRGPRGGRCGNWVDGSIYRRCRTYQEALDCVQELRANGVIE
jgi:hypothetical protein